jgi:hypothetical protein
MRKLLTTTSVIAGAAVWFVLFVLLGTGIVTAFIAGACVLVAMLLIAAALSIPGLGWVLEAPLTAPGLVLGIAAFIVLEVVLSVPMWIGVVAGMGTVGLYSVIDAAIDGPRTMIVNGVHTTAESSAVPTPSAHNGHDRTGREPVAAR